MTPTTPLIVGLAVAIVVALVWGGRVFLQLRKEKGETARLKRENAQLSAELQTAQRRLFRRGRLHKVGGGQ